MKRVRSLAYALGLLAPLAAAAAPTAPCDHGPSNISAWERSLDGKNWSVVTLPDTGWGCDNCTRYYRVKTCGKPGAVEFRWASDNKARLLVNGEVAVGEFWKLNMCTDKPCCSACCDTPQGCARSLSKSRRLGPKALALFTDSENELRWEVHQESGGSGFTGEFKITPTAAEATSAKAPAAVTTASSPRRYSIMLTSLMTEMSMFGGKASEVRIFRDGSKESVEIQVPGSEDAHTIALFDFEAHKAYTTHVRSKVCSWMRYVSDVAPHNYDPIAASENAPPLAKDAKPADLNGIPAVLEESQGPDGKRRMWRHASAGWPLKMEMARPDGTAMVLLEVRSIELEKKPEASLFVVPAGCSETMGTWSATGLDAHK